MGALLEKVGKSVELRAAQNKVLHAAVGSEPVRQGVKRGDLPCPLEEQAEDDARSLVPPELRPAAAPRVGNL